MLWMHRRARRRRRHQCQPRLQVEAPARLQGMAVGGQSQRGATMTTLLGLPKDKCTEYQGDDTTPLGSQTWRSTFILASTSISHLVVASPQTAYTTWSSNRHAQGVLQKASVLHSLSNHRGSQGGGRFVSTVHIGTKFRAAHLLSYVFKYGGKVI